MFVGATSRSCSLRFGACASSSARTACQRSWACARRIRSKFSECSARAREPAARLDAGPPRHEHPWDECYYILEGNVRFTLGERVDLFEAGDFLYAPAGTVHGFQGASDTPARMLVFDAPAAAEGFFREVDREVRQMPRDLAKVPEIAARHRMRFLPDPART